jgi:hypothetical protein
MVTGERADGNASRAVRLPTLGRLATARLWLSYQRYAFVLVGAPALCVTLAATYGTWWIVTIAAVIAIAPVRFAFEVLGRWPRKLRATRVGMARIAAGSFAAVSVRGYCSDPCFRVVARELLARAGVARSQRRSIIRRFVDEVRRERDVVIVFDHVRGTALTLGGDVGKAN